MSTTAYTIEIHDEGDGYLWGQVVELPGCFVSGADVDELMAAAAEAIPMYLADGPDQRPNVVTFPERPSRPGVVPTEAKLLLEA